MAKRNVFTFQYVSILMGIEPINPTLKEIYIPICFYFNTKGGRVRRINFVFTFQYVSILINIFAGINESNKNLHSNMFLF